MIVRCRSSSCPFRVGSFPRDPTNIPFALRISTTVCSCRLQQQGFRNRPAAKRHSARAPVLQSCPTLNTASSLSTPLHSCATKFVMGYFFLPSHANRSLEARADNNFTVFFLFTT